MTLPTILALQLSPADGFGGGMMLPLLALLAVFYFFMILPQNSKRKREKKFLAALKKGSKVVTSSGIHGHLTTKNDKDFVSAVPVDSSDDDKYDDDENDDEKKGKKEEKEEEIEDRGLAASMVEEIEELQEWVYTIAQKQGDKLAAMERIHQKRRKIVRTLWRIAGYSGDPQERTSFPQQLQRSKDGMHKRMDTSAARWIRTWKTENRYAQHGDGVHASCDQR